jgi:phosphate transport system substrate-binding protein
MNIESTEAAGFVGHYDLSDLPLYTPARVEDTDHCHNDVCKGEWGVIRIQGGENFMSLITAWQNAFLAMHSSIRFANFFNPSGFGGLTTKKFDIGTLGHAVWRTDVAAFRNVFGRNPHEIRLSGPFDQKGGIQPAPVFIVNKENPLAGLTLDEIDGIFGAERTGGWTNFYEWTTEAARSDAADIRSWGQLGLGGEWADAPIRPYGFDATLSGWSHLIQQVAFKGGGKWNPAVVEKVRGGLKKVGDDEMVEAVLNDKFAIGFNLPKVVNRYPDLKVLPIAASAGEPFVTASRQTLFDRTYPLTNNAYIYVDKPPEGLSDRLKEFLRFVLSRQGQQILADQDRLTPLNAEDSRRQIAALD